MLEYYTIIKIRTELLFCDISYSTFYNTSEVLNQKFTFYIGYCSYSINMKTYVNKQ
jgi:hypothetical protein